MAVHFIHVSKAGGTALRHAIREGRALAEDGRLMSPWGPVWGHDHRFRLINVENGDKAVIPLRDPISRFVSGFYSRLRKGEPRYYREWRDEERTAFEWFSTPRELAEALAQPAGEARRRAEFAMKSIRHLKHPMTRWVGRPPYLRTNLDKVLYMARQETLDEDWERLKELLELPAQLYLPEDDYGAHRTSYPGERTLSATGARALRERYARDYELLDIAGELRAGRVPRVKARDRLAELETVARKLRRRDR